MNCRLTLAIIVVASAVALCGCGSSDTPAQKAFGGLSDSDVHQLNTWSDAHDELADRYTDFIGAVLLPMRASQVQAAQKAEAAMRTALNTAQTSASKIGNTDLREALVAQDKPTSAMVASYQDILNVARQPDATRHQAKIRSIASRANAEAQAAGDAHDHVVSSLAQVMTPEQRKQYLAEVKQRAAESAARGKAAVTGG